MHITETKVIMAIHFASLPLTFALLFVHGVVELHASSHPIYKHIENLESTPTPDQPYRTGYHFQPPKNWMNDPAGPMIYKGIYHLFYQYNPYCATWGNIVWGHSTSTDLVHWNPQKIAIYPSQESDINGVWSGSATILNGKPVMLYTGTDKHGHHVLNRAEPKNLSDPYLKEWIKSPENPVMSRPTFQNQSDVSSFSDPTTAWLGPDGSWRVLVGSKIESKPAILYTSKDFVHWIQSQHTFHSASSTGMWEFPDFFPVSVNSTAGVDTSSVGPNVTHVLKLSLDDTKHDYYTIGAYDHVEDVYTPDKRLAERDSGMRYDHGKFYASKTFFDNAKNRRILWGWINESSNVEDDMRKGWSGLQGLPRSIWLDKSGKQLIQWPIKEIETLHMNPINLPSIVLGAGSVLEVYGVTAAQADIKISFWVPDHLDKAEIMDPSWTNPHLLCSQKNASVGGSLGPFGLLVLASKDLQEYTSVFFRIFKGQNRYVVLMCSDQSRSSMNQNNDLTTYGTFVDVDPVHKKLSLRSLIDHSIVESFGGGGKSCITARVYPTMAIHEDAHLYAFNNGTENVKITRLSAWSMKKANIN